MLLCAAGRATRLTTCWKCCPITLTTWKRWSNSVRLNFAWRRKKWKTCSTASCQGSLIDCCNWLSPARTVAIWQLSGQEEQAWGAIRCNPSPLNFGLTELFLLFVHCRHCYNYSTEMLIYFRQKSKIGRWKLRYLEKCIDKVVTVNTHNRRCRKFAVCFGWQTATFWST